MPPLVIGRGCKLSPGNRIGPYAVLGDGAQIEEKTVIESSVLLPQSQVAFDQRVKGVIGGREEVLYVEKYQ